MVAQRRVSHALLFLGKEGAGGLSLARGLAQYLVCEVVNGVSKPAASSLFDEAPDEGTQKPADSCGVCSACKKASQLVHPDIHFSFPVIPTKSGDKPISADYIKEWRDFAIQQPYGNSYDWLQFIGAENRQGNITSRECDEITRKISLKSFEGGHKILIMWMPELLGKEGNKLLKLIEEPPADTVFILVAENESLLLPTILSRTQLIKVPLLSQLQIEAALELKQGIPVARAQQVAAVSNGNFREALSQLRDADEDWEKLLRDWLNCIIKKEYAAQVKWVEDVGKIGRERQKQFLKYFTHLLERGLRLQVHGEPESNPGTDHLTAFARRINKFCDASQLEAIATELDQSAYYIERNANAKILFHALSIRLGHIISNKSVILVQ